MVVAKGPFHVAKLVAAIEDNHTGMSGRRPVVKGRFEDTVNVSGAVMSSAF